MRDEDYIPDKWDRACERYHEKKDDDAAKEREEELRKEMNKNGTKD